MNTPLRRWIVGLAVGMLAVVAATSGIHSLAAPTWPGGVEEVGFADGAFYARIDPNLGIGERWLASTDGGDTWTRAAWVPALASAPASGRESWTACADDGVCYRARMDYPSGYPTVDSRHLVERRAAGSDWVVEADLDTAPAFIGLAVSPADSSQVVAISWRYGFARDAQGSWHERDLAELGSDPAWVRSVVRWVDSRLVTLGLVVALSVLGWLLLPSLQARWLLQSSVLVVGGLLWLFSALFFGQGLFWANLVWPAVTVAVVLLIHRSRTGRPSRAEPAQSAPGPGFDPPSGAR
ncbi:MAG: hypothetical protein LCH96_18115 [Actinobacteria bacterium]|nr:hypothetical protein [Actinomycetota bacterium]